MGVCIFPANALQLNTQRTPGEKRTFKTLSQGSKYSTCENHEKYFHACAVLKMAMAPVLCDCECILAGRLDDIILTPGWQGSVSVMQSFPSDNECTSELSVQLFSFLLSAVLAIKLLLPVDSKETVWFLLHTLAFLFRGNRTNFSRPVSYNACMQVWLTKTDDGCLFQRKPSPANWLQYRGERGGEGGLSEVWRFSKAGRWWGWGWVEGGPQEGKPNHSFLENFYKQLPQTQTDWIQLYQSSSDLFVHLVPFWFNLNWSQSSFSLKHLLFDRAHSRTRQGSIWRWLIIGFSHVREENYWSW